MASVSGALAKQQFRAVASARWAATMHSVKTMRGKLELVSRILVIAFYSAFGLFFGIGAGVLSYFAVINRQAELISGMVWFLFGFWQLYPILRAGYSNTFDASTLLRFPVTYRTYFSLRCFYGALEPVALVGVFALIGITVGVTMASPALLPWCVLIAALIIALNILTTQLALTWVERWLAKRRSREILGMLFFVFIIALQFIGPMTRSFENRGNRSKAPIRITRESIRTIVSAERMLPPGLAGYTLNKAQKQQYLRAALALAGLGAYGSALVLLLDLRLRKQYRGESFGETSVKQRMAADKSLRVGWNIPGSSAPLSAMVEKEARYLIRSGPMLLSFLMPLVVLLIFGGTGARQIPQQLTPMTFPLVAAYSLLILTNVVYNTFGADHAGVQFYFMSPLPLRRVLLAKNAVHAAIFVAELALLWVAVKVLRATPELWVTAATVAAIPYALGLELSAGNLLSIYGPKKLEFQMMGRQRTPQTSALLALVMHAFVIATSGLVFFAARRYGISFALPAFLLMGASGIALYAFILKKAEALAMQRRETLFEALCRE
jgi:ABC-2 type transport system permease protein